MSRYNNYFANDFGSCRLLAYAFDHCRNRQVRIFLMPGEIECVGISDGTDKWIAPVSDTLFSVNIKNMLRDLQDGIPLPHPVPPQPKGIRKRSVLIGADPPARKRRHLLTENQPQPRSRHVLT